MAEAETEPVLSAIAADSAATAAVAVAATARDASGIALTASALALRIAAVPVSSATEAPVWSAIAAVRDAPAAVVAESRSAVQHYIAVYIAMKDLLRQTDLAVQPCSSSATPLAECDPLQSVVQRQLPLADRGSG